MVDIFRRTANVDDKAAVMEAIKTSKLGTIQHPIDFTLPVGDKRRPHQNICITPVIPGSGRRAKASISSIR